MALVMADMTRVALALLTGRLKETEADLQTERVEHERTRELLHKVITERDYLIHKIQRLEEAGTL